MKLETNNNITLQEIFNELESIKSNVEYLTQEYSDLNNGDEIAGNGNADESIALDIQSLMKEVEKALESGKEISDEEV